MRRCERDSGEAEPLFLYLIELGLGAGGECGEIEIGNAGVCFAYARQDLPQSQFSLNTESQHFERFERAEAPVAVALQFELCGFFGKPAKGFRDIEMGLADGLDEVTERVLILLNLRRNLAREGGEWFALVLLLQRIEKLDGEMRAGVMVVKIDGKGIAHAPNGARLSPGFTGERLLL